MDHMANPFALNQKGESTFDFAIQKSQRISPDILELLFEIDPEKMAQQIEASLNSAFRETTNKLNKKH